MRVWLVEEKQTDVRIALDAYRAAINGTVEQVVIVSNDSDLVPLLEALKHDAPHVTRGAVIPRAETAWRQPAEGFVSQCHWVRRYIRDDELQVCQFPRAVPCRKKAAIKPEYW